MAKIIVVDIINVSPSQHVPTPKGGYNVLEVAYKESGKVGGKKLFDFANPAVFNLVSQLKQGDRVEVTLEKEAAKDGREFWQWKEVRQVAPGEVGAGSQEGSVQESASPVAHAAAPTTPYPTARPAGKVTGSNYETAEERAAKQIYIVRQSSITAALKLFEGQAKLPSVFDVIHLAEQFKEYVFNGIQNGGKDSRKETGQAKQEGIRVSGTDNAVAENIPVKVPVQVAPVKRGRPPAAKAAAPQPTPGYMQEYEQGDVDQDIPAFLNSLNS